MAFSPQSAELHLGILQNRMKDIKGQMTACMAKMNMDEKVQKDNEIDPKKEAQRFKELDKKYLALQNEVAEYEDKCLAATNF